MEQQQTKQITQKEQEQFQCIICYELPFKPTFTKCCNQITCLKHINSFQDKCPNCRQTPFETKQIPEIQNQILEILQRDKVNYDKIVQRNQQVEKIKCQQCQDIPRKPVLTNCCQKVTCYRHTIEFKNKCYFCQNTPFKHIEDKEFNQEVFNFKIEQCLKEKQILPCKCKNCDFSGHFDLLKQHFKDQHQQEIDTQYIQKHIESIELKEVVKCKMERGSLIRRERLMRELYVQHLRETRLPSHGIKKLASSQQRIEMRNHVNQCHNPGCKQLWSGSWGPFIGGDQGRTHFDLTECQQGKQLNLNIGWNYNDPAN